MRVLISGGGTGGHIFPALAVAQALTEREPGVEILYVGRSGGMEERLVPDAGLELETLAVSGIQDEPWKNIPLLYRLPASVLRAASLIRRFKPDVVFGSGGYVAGAMGAGAVLTRRPLVLQVPDAVPGRAVRMLAGRAFAVCTAYDSSADRLPGARVVNTGNPLRPEFARRGRELRAAAADDSWALRNMLVFGGSQGAHRLNVAVEEGLKTLLEIEDLSVHHLCGQADFHQLHAMRRALPQKIRERYNVEAFNPDMFKLLSAADLVVSRAGGSIGEMTALGLPMILVPYPYAGAHQNDNAEPLRRSGAAVIVPDSELSGVRLVGDVKRLAADPRLLGRMAKASLAFGRPEAAHDVAKLIVEAAAAA